MGRRGELAREVVHPEVRAVGPDLLGCDRELDGLEQCIRGRSCLRLRRWRPVAEREESDLLHALMQQQPGVRLPGYPDQSTPIPVLSARPARIILASLGVMDSATSPIVR